MGALMTKGAAFLIVGEAERPLGGGQYNGEF